MGILNVTPDSFSDGGKFLNAERAVEHALSMIHDGADIIDVGGESTRPNSEPISVQEEIDRVMPVIEKLIKETDIPISIDTYKSDVAKVALDCGVSIVNDISGLRFDPQMPQIVARYGSALVVMHIKGTPKTMQQNPVYVDVVNEIKDYLFESIKIAEKNNISSDRIVIDPGIGFGKTVEHNLIILKRLKEFEALNKPILIGPSRKSFIGKILDLQVDERLEGTLGCISVGIMNGANIIRVHDVKPALRTARMVDAIIRTNNQ